MFTLEEAESIEESGPAEDVWVYTTGNFLDEVNPANGAATKVGPSFGGSRFVQSLDFGADGVLYGLGTVLPQGLLGPGTGFVFTLNPDTGAATAGARLAASGKGTFTQALAVAAPSCPAPPPPPVIQPTFTG